VNFVFVILHYDSILLCYANSSSVLLYYFLWCIMFGRHQCWCLPILRAASSRSAAFATFPHPSFCRLGLWCLLNCGRPQFFATQWHYWWLIVDPSRVRIVFPEDYHYGLHEVEVLFYILFSILFSSIILFYVLMKFGWGSQMVSST
jgi:hypothetical protein